MQNSNLESRKMEADITVSLDQEFVQLVDHLKVLPGFLKNLYTKADVKNCNDAIVLVLHALMLEVGFIPKDVAEDENLETLPKSWNCGGVYRIMYHHLTCSELSCLMTCIPLNQLLSIFGTVDDVSSFQEITICVKVPNYVNQHVGFSDPSKVFFNMRELSIDFKDNFAHSLLAAMQDALGFGPTFGLSVLMDHIKLQILSYLPVESLLAISCVNKEFNDLGNTPSIWENLYLKDFLGAAVGDEKLKQGWKQVYKEKYLLHKRQLGRQCVMFPPQSLFEILQRPGIGWYPPIRPHPGFGPPFQIGIPEEVRNAFPQLQRGAIRNNIIHQPDVPRNPSQNFPSMFKFF